MPSLPTHARRRRLPARPTLPFPLPPLPPPSPSSPSSSSSSLSSSFMRGNGRSSTPCPRRHGRATCSSHHVTPPPPPPKPHPTSLVPKPEASWESGPKPHRRSRAAPAPTRQRSTRRRRWEPPLSTPPQTTIETSPLRSRLILSMRTPVTLQITIRPNLTHTHLTLTRSPASRWTPIGSTREVSSRRPTPPPRNHPHPHLHSSPLTHSPSPIPPPRTPPHTPPPPSPAQA